MKCKRCGKESVVELCTTSCELSWLSYRVDELEESNKQTNDSQKKVESRLKVELAKHQWASVDERLPKYGVPVLVVSCSLGIKPTPIITAVLACEDDAWHWEEWQGVGALNDHTNYEWDDDYQYTHWQPLPDPPKEKEQEDYAETNAD